MSRDSRARREKKTSRTMVAMYCTTHHGPEAELCPDCRELLVYSEARVDRCVFKRSKPTCAKCPVHCYEKTMRARMKIVMRYAGPRMLASHPALTIAHMIDGLRRPQR